MPPPRVAVAASGGRDSTALLHCTLRQARPLGVQVLALHVHHGLMPQADAWLARLRTQSRRWGAHFMHRRLAAGPAPGESVEAWAREGRYRALAEMAHEAGCDCVLLAHHRRDQAETWLLQALRGGGAAGLSAMPALAWRQGIHWARPWLAMPREAIESYLQRHRLSWVEDSSNGDPRFDRNRLRQQVWPALALAFRGAEAALAAAAARAQEDSRLREEVAALDLPGLLSPQGLRMAPWLALPDARRRNALRTWLAGQWPGGVPETLVARLCAELPATASGRWPAPGGELRLYRHALSFAALAPASPRDAPAPALNGPARAVPVVACGLAPPDGGALDLSQPGEVSVPHWCGRFVVSPAGSGGAEPTLLQQVRARARQGGERFRLAPQGAARSLKKQFQAMAVAAWDRQGPLLYAADGRLLFAPGLGVDAALQAAPGEPQLQLRWVPDAAPSTTGRRQRPR